MIREDQRIRQHDILPSSSSKHHNLGNIIWRQRLDTFVHGIGFSFVTTEAND
jgi:hypothetical protein